MEAQPLELILDVSRADNAEDPFRFHCVRQEYRRFPWEPRLLNDLSELMKQEPDPARVQPLGDMLRTFLEDLGWQSEEHRLRDALDDNTACVWDVVSGKPLAELRGHSALVKTAEFSPDGVRVVTASADKTARVWDTASGKPLVEFRGHTDPVDLAAFSPDGLRVVTASADETACIWGLDLCAPADELFRRWSRELTPQERRKYLLEGVT